MSKNNLVIILLAAVLLTACGNTSSATEPAIDTTISSVTETEETHIIIFCFSQPFGCY